jgi:hypothetical protein
MFMKLYFNFKQSVAIHKVVIRITELFLFFYSYRNDPQSRAPPKWGEGAKSVPATRHYGCPTVVPSGPHVPKELRIGTGT